MRKPYPAERRVRAVKMVLDHLDEYRSVHAARQMVGPQVCAGPESLRKGKLQAQIDAQQSGVSSAKHQSVKGSEREVRDLTETEGILKAASISFAGNSALTSVDLPVHRADAPGELQGRRAVNYGVESTGPHDIRLAQFVV